MDSVNIGLSEIKYNVKNNALEAQGLLQPDHEGLVMVDELFSGVVYDVTLKLVN